nr:immunoglobulin light chain junction region [Macaca mulatta]MOV34128.1 immunoglobulin light chain junction region [Macaca mulatta]MOV34131.1 immunoglobulin light chain junction region [Macaca mulatta]MOV34185.1 immunoglobulin light chain junction region [Macaca mulatta]MOV34194.1 immunoglobulin light chain junction region [Macaca mulatta]
CQHGYGSPYSF